jgi:Flp pilus assembly CpaE family ATPase
VAQVLGLLDEAPGLAAACRAASTGSLEPATLARLAPEASPGLRVLTGISRSARWPELSSAALEEVLRVARSVARWTVVDCGALLEADEELSFDTAAPRRNAATLTALESADVVLAVGAADPVGLQRLVRGLQELADVVPTATPRVVVTRVRASAVGSSPQQRVADALARYAGVADVVLVPDDRAACDAALLAGRTLTEAASGSPARLALAALAGELAGRTVQPRARGRRRSARLRA